MSRRGSGQVALVALALLAGACSHDEDNAAPKRTVRALGRSAPIPGQGAAANAGEGDDGTRATGSGSGSAHVDIMTPDAAPPPITYTVITKASGAAAAPDPDVAVIDAARVSAAACFTNIKDNSPSRSAAIHVVVLPSGGVNRTEVTAPGTEESWILSCLEGVGGGLRFSEKPKADIRNFTVNVTVTASRPGH